MHEHETQSHETVERHCDVAVIGGSAAGLAAALQLGRQRRSVIVVDSGEPRNAPASHMHGYLGHEGLPPSDLVEIGRREVRGYGVEVLSGRAIDVTLTDDGSFRVGLDSGHSLIARKVLAATGLIDELPPIPGLAEHWGNEVIHCPFCHGFEARDRRIAQIVTHPLGLHPAGLFRQLTDRLTVILHDGVAEDDPEVAALRQAGVEVLAQRVSRVTSDDDGGLKAVELENGETLAVDVVAVGPRARVRAEAFASLGLEPTPHPSGLGDYVVTDETGETSVPGLYAAGNLADPSQQVLQAAANGSRVGAMISFSLAREDMEAASRPSPGQRDWDHRYRGEPVWSGNPNPGLVAEVADIAPGRALDVGAGEGGDAIWLAERGWQVTASDLSDRALDRLATEADRRGVKIECLTADATALDAFEPDAFDLVTAHYVPIPRSPDRRGVRNLIDAVAPGGTLLVVNHDLEPLRQQSGHRPFDVEAFESIDGFVDELEGAPGWEIEVHETRPRNGPTGSPHANDIVLRARRRAA